MAKAPLSVVKKDFGDKAKLVEAVKAFMTEDLWIGRTSADRGGSKSIDHVSNAKLLRLHKIFSEVKTKFGTRAKLIEAVLEAEGRSKDAGYKIRLEKMPVPRLADELKAANRRKKNAAARA
jgi:hypothetical protein